jgi:ribosome biogenesis GTPase
VAAGHADPRRLASYRRLLASRAGDLDPRTHPEESPDELPTPPPSA